MNQNRSHTQRRISSAILVLLCIALAHQPASAQIKQTPPEIDEATRTNLAIVTAGRAFAVDLYKELARDEASAGKNIAFAPLPLENGLSMLAEGARGRTAEQINVVLHHTQALRAGPLGEGPAVPLDLLPVHRMMGWIGQQLRQATPKTAPTTSLGDALIPEELFAFNALGVDQGFPLQQSFTQTVGPYYNAESLIPVDFRSNADAARQKMNSLMESQTRLRFKDAIPAGAIDPSTRMMLASAVSLKGGFLFPFSRFETRRALFRVDVKRDMQSWLMRNASLNTWYSDGNLYQAVALPMQGASFDQPDMTMIIILPRRPDGLQELEDTLVQRRLDEWISLMNVRPVDIMLPQFKVSNEYNLTRQLATLGMRDAVSSSAADFTGMSAASGERLSLTSVTQKTELSIAEEGADVPMKKTGGGATGLPSNAIGRETRPMPFRADHPFIFMIYHHPTNTILLMGRVTTQAM